jgi:hypothetical protein
MLNGGSRYLCLLVYTSDEVIIGAVGAEQWGGVGTLTVRIWDTQKYIQFSETQIAT